MKRAGLPTLLVALFAQTAAAQERFTTTTVRIHSESGPVVLRVELAIHRLRTTGDSIDHIAAAVGYSDGVTLRTLLRKKTGRGIRELRASG